MPPRLVSLAILLCWALAAFALFRRDLLPRLVLGPPPDLRSIAQDEASREPTHWSLRVADRDGEARDVGQVVTKSERKTDGFVRLSSTAWFDSGELLKGTPIRAGEGERFEIGADFDVDRSGNLEHFRAWLRPFGDRRDLLTITGKVTGNDLVVMARGPIPLLNWKNTYPYQPRGMVQSALGPLDRMPGLQVGQRWESRVVSPLTGQVQSGRVEVARSQTIMWDNNPVKTFEVVTKLEPLSARTWVRAEDGSVLKQEFPTPFVTLLLERLPKAPAGPGEFAPEGARR